MHTLSTLLLVMLLGVSAAFADLPRIPRANEVVRYQREQPVFQSRQIARERGDALLALLDGGRAVERWMKNGLPPGIAEVLPVPARLWLSITLTNGTTYRIGVSQGGGLLYLPEGLYKVVDASSRQAAKWMAEMEADLRHEVVSAPKPCIYTMGTVDDGGTLSGVARLFYGDASKWRLIYDANRAVLKNPNAIRGTEKLTIPMLK